jgi:uncharacterized protein YndB with AHSA1/START domain
MITVTVTIEKPLQEVWKRFTLAADVMNWNNASEDWHCPKAENNLTVGERFIYTMAAKDGSVSFDFIGVYTEIELYKKIAYTIEDGRKVEVLFETKDDKITVTENFEPENIHSEELQQQGWQSILNNFKNYSEKQ